MKKNNLRQIFLRRVCSGENLWIFKIFILLLLFVGLNTRVNAGEFQQMRVTGKVSDSKTGDGLPGVNVIILGTTIGTITENNGNYSINVPGASSVLSFSFLGYISQSVTVGNQSVINVNLVEEVTALEEVVVVGYGTQAKVNLTGSVGAVRGSEITKRPVPNVQNLLAGKVSGLQVVQRGGEPGNDVGNMRIRGVGTFSSAGTNPLVLIDGVEGNINYLDPDNIENVSVLKDAASAAIYGARAANGVILITTKRGKAGDVSVEYHVALEAQNPTRLPDLLYNSAQYMEYWNEANIRAGMIAYFTQAEIDAYRNNTDDPVHYPNFNWIDHCYKTGFVQNHHLSVSGGNEKTQFVLSAGFLDQSGVVDLFAFKRYNVLMSLDSKINDWITVGGNMRLLKSDKVADVQSQYSEAYFIMHTFGPGPIYTPTMTLPDGSTGFVARYSSGIAEWTVRNPDAMIAQGENLNGRYNMSPQIYADIKLTKDLTWYTKGAAIFDYNFVKNHEDAVNNYYFKDGAFAHNGAPWHLGVIDDVYTNFNTTFYSTLNYRKKIGVDHNVNILAGYNQETSFYRTLGGTRVTFPATALNELNAGSATGQTARGTASEWAIQSFFGRVNYDFRSKYLFEANARYDGTSRIHPDTRWGFFPSVSAGWRMSEESFMQNLNWLDNLKLRASWGQLGNQNVGTYPYQNVLSTTQYPFSSLESGARLTRLVDQTLKWETTSVTDIGVDASIKNGLLSLTVDWYNKITDDILYSIPVPASVGLSAPTVNGGKMKNTGWDFELGHANQVGEFRYDITGNISFYKNEVLDIISPTLATNTVQEGIPYGSWYMVEWIGIFQNQSEIDEGPTHQFNPKPGDLKFKDQLTIDSNGDGVKDQADGVINANDRVVVDGYYPDFYYGFGANVFWKNFDLTVFFQGVQGIKNYSTNWGITPYTQGSPPTMDLVKNQWTGEGSTNKYPAMYRAGYNPVTGTTSTYWLFDASYLRLKNLRLGYNLPASFAKKIGMKEAQVYFSGDNVLTFTKYPGSDPERTSQGAALSIYPNLRTLAFGIKVKL
jgi:TonB-linked SusC/RagA family outer membrane protein